VRPQPDNVFLQKPALVKMTMIDSAETDLDLTAPPPNGLEKQSQGDESRAVGRAVPPRFIRILQEVGLRRSTTTRECRLCCTGPSPRRFYLQCSCENGLNGFSDDFNLQNTAGDE
jgi:hypothetical protein